MTIYDAPVDDTVFFPVSGDMMRLMKHQEEEKEVAVATHANECDRHNQCQIIEKGNPMSKPNSTNVPAQKSPTWAVPAKRWQYGTDVMHLGETRRLEGVNADGSEYHFEAERTQLEEVGTGFVTDPYLVIRAGGEGTYDAVFTVDLSELEKIAGWVLSLRRHAVLTRASDIKARAAKP